MQVRWPNGHTNTYRNGAEGANDVMVHPGVRIEKSVRKKTERKNTGEKGRKRERETERKRKRKKEKEKKKEGRNQYSLNYICLRASLILYR